MAYIDRELLLQDISENVVFTVRDGATSPELRGAKKIIDRIKNAPTTDVAEVVRCKNCQSYNGHRYCNYHADPVMDDDFCSYGERRDT